MNAKNAKLVRYFVKQTRDIQMGAKIITQWPYLTHKAKGQISSWMKRVTVALMAVKDSQKRHEAQRRAMISARNLDVLKGFVS